MQKAILVFVSQIITQVYAVIFKFGIVSFIAITTHILADLVNKFACVQISLD